MFRIIHVKSGLCVKPQMHEVHSKFSLESQISSAELFKTTDSYFIHESSQLVLGVNDEKQLELQEMKKFNPKQKWTVEGDFIVNCYFDEAIQEDMTIKECTGSSNEKFRIQME
ncbi:Ricin_B-like lectins [Hexamita inflata]|uniref:Ricin B-like lectins n=1 Tax=Hexamita inflata TaxID=28002 RepID=A0AA86P5X5_9EUKA|nr:Ricin B-like lectins [Hexamita inflata]